MLDGCVPWPPKAAARFRQLGLWEDITVSEMVERTMRAMPDKPAVVFGDRRISYQELVRSSKRLALALLDLGLKPRDRVVVQLPNVPEFVIAYLALNWMGAIPVMALRAHRHAEVRHFIGGSGATAYLVADAIGSFDYRPMAAEMAAEFPFLRHVIVAGEPAPGQQALDPLIDGRTVDDSTVAARLATVRPSADEVSTMLLSGGTTSVSKLIPRTHNDYVLNARLCAKAAGFDRDTVFMAILPLGHNYNLASPGLLGTFHAGGTVVVAAGTDIEATFALVERERVSVIASVVPLISNWLNSDVPRRHDLSSLKVVQNGGARLAPELRIRLREQLRCTPQEIYGTAEGLINMTRLDDPDDLLLESSGAPVSEFDEIKVLDDDDREVPDGEVGELVTRGPYTIRGYYNAPEKNAEAFTPDGFYRMGDIVRKRGRHVFTEGRRKDLINRGGEKINAEEVELLLLAHPHVVEAALVAMPDPRLGERGCAYLATDGTPVTLADLQHHLRALDVAKFKWPERVELLEALPRTKVGKLDKLAMAADITARLENP
jgi:2,3-dihydroxybenzoate-AMP ligase